MTYKESKKLLEEFKYHLNKRFELGKKSLDDRHIFSLKDDDDDETDYGFLDEYIENLIEAAKTVQRMKDIRIVETHNEGEGQWCDTGEDMEWSCRSECVKSALARLQASP